MNFITNTSELKNKLLVLKRSFNPNHTLPSLKGISFSTQNNKLVVRATDLYFGTKFVIDAKIIDDGNIVVLGDRLIEVLSTLADNEEIRFRVDNQHKHLLLKGKSVKIKLPLINDQFPEFPSLSGDGVLLTLDQIKEINRYVTSSASIDMTRPILTGILLSFYDEKVDVVATDGYRLAMMRLNSKVSHNKTVIIPARVFIDLEKTMIEEKEDQLVLELDQSQFQARCLIGKVEVYIRLIEGEYPPYQKIIPQQFNLQVTVSADQLLTILKQARIFSKTNSNIVQLRVKKGLLEIYANVGDSSYYSYELKDVVIEGEEFNLAFNINYLIDLVMKAKNKDIVIKAVESLRPVMFTIDGIDNLSYVIMPIKIHQ